MSNDIYEIDYTPYDCVYFDIPYENTSKYEVDFDHAKFWDFFMSLPQQAFASSYQAPAFVPCVKEINKRALMQNKSNNGMQQGLEKVFANYKN